MTDRLYDDAEVAAIFRAATEGAATPAPAAGPSNGLTLGDLQAIAREVDVSPEAVARAARSLDAPRAPAASRTFLGLPVGVQRTVTLDRPLTDAEWELLVVELREVFAARGTVRSEGSLREWSNGNLHVFLEPTPAGQRLRLRTYKSDVRASVTLGGLSLGGAAAMAAANIAQGWLATATLAAFGLAFAANGALRLPAWARLRGSQMDGIIERVTRSTRATGTLPPTRPDTPA